MTAPLRNSTAEWQALDSRHHIHPFTDHAALAEAGTRIIVRGDGAYVWDSEGKRILDAFAGLWCVNVGYGRQALADTAHRQMLELPYYNSFFKTATTPSLELSQILVELTPPGLNHVFYGLSGSDANDSIVHMVRAYWNLRGLRAKKTIISRENAYHGITLLGSSLGGMKYMHEPADLPLAGFSHIMQPYWYGLGGDLSPAEFGLKAAAALETRILELGPDNVAAFIGEPIQGAGGVIIPPPGYWAEIQRICAKYEVLLIADEVICGFGRLGTWFGCHRFGITPDLITCAKGITSGYLPLGAVIASPRVQEPFWSTPGSALFRHGYTYSGHPAVCAAGLANLDILEREGLIERVARLEPVLAEAMGQLQAITLVHEVRAGVGLLAAVEVDPEARAADPGIVDRLVAECRDRGVLTRGLAGHSLQVSPSFVIDESDLNRIAEVFAQALSGVSVRTGV